MLVSLVQVKTIDNIVLSINREIVKKWWAGELNNLNKLIKWGRKPLENSAVIYISAQTHNSHTQTHNTNTRGNLFNKKRERVKLAKVS